MQGSARELSSLDVALLQALLCLGQYPRFALPDEHNAGRAVAEQLFHTRRKRDVLLHPSSSLQHGLSGALGGGSGGGGGGGGDDGGGDGDGERATEREVGGSSRGGSAGAAGRAVGPQLLVYATLLQTRKPYLLNCVSVAALPALLLAAMRVDTSADCRRLVVDSWLLVTIDSSERAVRLLVTAHRLRLRLAALQQLRLAGCAAAVPHAAEGLPSRHSGALNEAPPAIAALAMDAPREQAEANAAVAAEGGAAQLGELVGSFMLSSSGAAAARYAVSRVKLSELAAHFASAGRGAVDRQQRLADCVQAAIHDGRDVGDEFDALKAGVPLAQWLCWGSARAEGGAEAASGGGAIYMRRHARCEACGASLIVTSAEMRAHMQSDECRLAASLTGGTRHAAPRDDERAAAPQPSQALEPPPAPVVHVAEAPQSTGAHGSSAGVPGAGGGSAPSMGTSTLGKRTHFECEICEKSFLFTQLDIMRHHAAHRAAGDG